MKLVTVKFKFLFPESSSSEGPENQVGFILNDVTPTRTNVMLHDFFSSQLLLTRFERSDEFNCSQCWPVMKIHKIFLYKKLSLPERISTLNLTTHLKSKETI